MKKHFSFFLILYSFIGFSQKSINNISVQEVPQSVLKIFNEYIDVLNSTNLDICANNFTKIAGGSLINTTGKELRSNVKPFLLKSDFENIKNYPQVLKIQEVSVTSSTQGFGQNSISGELYKIWVLPISNDRKASISILLPDEHCKNRDAKIVNIGTL